MSGLDQVAMAKWYQFRSQLGDAGRKLRGRPAPEDGADAQLGASNMWGVGPARTAGGGTMLVSDPHLPWHGLQRWYEHQITVGERWIYGVGIFGLAGTGIGFTQDLAWGSTNNAADTVAVYRVRLHREDDTKYRYDRQWRVLELLGEEGALTPDDMVRIAMDVRALTADPFIEPILAAVARRGTDADDIAEAADILRAWDREATTDNLALAILAAYVDAGGRPGSGAPRQDARVLEALGRALEALRSRHGTIRVPWGEVHVLQRGDNTWPLAGAGNAASAVPFTTLYMTGALQRVRGRAVADRGSSWMMVVHYHDGKVEAQTVLPFGNSEDSESPHYADQAPLFAARTLKRALLTREDVLANLTARTVLEVPAEAVPAAASAR